MFRIFFHIGQYGVHIALHDQFLGIFTQQPVRHRFRSFRIHVFGKFFRNDHYS